jgi:hypothetical protein
MMDNDPRPILPGSRVRAYDPVIDAFADGTVLCRYGYKSISHSDVVFDDYGDQVRRAEGLAVSGPR